MSRIRNIKPTFFTDEIMALFPRDIRLFFIGLWTECDSGGVFEWKPFQLKLKLFPADQDITREKIESFLSDLLLADRIRKFQSGGDAYGFVVQFAEHQVISKSEKDKGKRFSNVPKPVRNGSGTVPERLTNDSGMLDIGHRTMDTGHRTQDPATPLVSPADDPLEILTPAEPPAKPSKRSRRSYELAEVRAHGGDVAPWNRPQWGILLDRWTLPRISEAIDGLPIAQRKPGDVDRVLTASVGQQANLDEFKPRMPTPDEIAEATAVDPMFASFVSMRADET